MALGRGLNMAIVNPSSPMIVDMIRSSDVLSGRDQKMRKYLQTYANTDGPAAAKTAASASLPEQLRHGILRGDESGIGKTVQAALAAGHAPQMLVDDVLIPAITEVGDRFDRKEYFLPQLVQSADAMRNAMNVLLPHLQSARESDSTKTGVILATVKGDIHDIGKNIVALMLQNYGFDVIDLGKDVPAEAILDAAQERNIKIVGLSALMTTTVPAMEETISLLKKNAPHIKIMVGGAVLTADFAARIGADFYAADGMGAVHVVKEFFKK
jgi:5-methyltetrahydrofolate--homocysteine methyltransferase